MKSGFAVNIMQIQTEDILILLRYNIKINTDQELLERTQLNFYTLPPTQSSWNFPQENLVSIHAELFKWKEKLSQVEMCTGFYTFRELDWRSHLRICFTLKFVSLVI